MQQFIGKVIYISDIQRYERTSRPDLTKVMIGVLGDDGQKVFFEARDLAIITLKRENIKLDDYVTVNYTFSGNIRGIVTYNNIVINNITLIKKTNSEISSI